ncbi:helicase SRCAP isoform X2 [Hyperolius riggenbachi]|uniref:helicase SRCAP isoform X2 n=1 Tax=Hyperolius riggenbachi TaxID=752182 RepID=UPI0035A3A1CA
MQPSPARKLPQTIEAVTASAPPMSPGSSGELSPFDLLSDIGDVGPASPTDDGLDGNQHDSTSAQKWDSTTEIAEQAKHEAEIENRIAELRKEGFWSPRRLSKFPEPTRPKVQWDYLCEEMQWLAADFAQERRWKRGVARKVVRMVVRHHEELKQKEERARREEQSKLRRIATSIAKEVRQFWSNVEKVVQFKQQSRLEAKRKKALDLQLDFIVGQTEKYSDLLSQSLNETIPVNKTGSSCVGSSQGGSLRTSPAPSLCQKDGEFLPQEDEAEEEDDEETIEIEERQDGNDAESHRLELELLRRESEVPLDELIQSLPPEILLDEADMEDPTSEDQDDDDEDESSSGEEVAEDDEFTANEAEAEDEEETIEAEEALDNQQDHSAELCELAQEGELSIEDLLKKYSLVRMDHEEAAEEERSRVSELETSETSECDSSDCESDGVEFLVKQEEEEPGPIILPPEHPEPKKEITDIAATAESLQPKGYTLATTQVKTAVPFLLRGDLREYQHIGLEWLVTMYEKKLNGILADEMGLGKTIQTISLLAHLACERGNWGPHLIIVPTSVILNWEMELKRWCPSFKILTYYGSQKERKLKRQGWTKANAFHVCITSYKLVLQDHQAFRRKNWRYLILDEAQNIKNFKSQRWQSLLNFNSQRRLLLTGTPLQNSLMELWSLMHFLMPHVFQSHREFKEWFSNPLTGMIEGSQEYNEGLIRRLHKVLRPFLLRRIKLDVEKQMPKKYEHVIYCRLSKRQRFLYDDFMSQAATKESLASGHFMSVINILMQLRKVCNHPNLFDPRPIHSPFITSAICYSIPSLVLHALQRHPLEYVDLSWFNLVNLEGRVSRYESDVFLPQYKPSRLLIQEICNSPEPPPRPRPLKMKVNRMLQPVVKPDPRSSIVMVNGSRPVPKVQDTPAAAASSTPPLPPPPPQPTPPPPPAPLPSAPVPPPPPPQCTSNPPVAAVAVQPMPVPHAPPPVQACPVPVSVPPMASEPPKPVPVQSSPQVYSTPQRFILTPDMQARLPTGEVISLSQLASLSGRPFPGPSVTKPLTLQLQGAKLTLGGTQVRPVGVGQPRPMQGNVLHLVSSGGQHHLLSQPAQLALIQALAQQATSPAPAQLVQNNTSSQIGVQALSVQGLQHPLMNNANLPPAAGPAMTSPGQGVVKIVVRQAPRDAQAPPQRPPMAPQVRPVLRVLPGPLIDQGNSREGSLERTAPVVATSAINLASSPLLMVSSPTVTTRLSSPNTEESSVPSMSGVALRLVATGTSPAVQLTNHRTSPPNHTGSPALSNCSPCATHNSAVSNCTTAQQMVSLDPTAASLLLKATQNTDTVLPDNHSAQNGSMLQNQNPSTDSLAATSCVPGATNSASPPVSSIPKVSPPTYNLSLVPALLANSATSNAARFLTSPLSLLALSPLSSTNSGPTSVIYTSPNATAFPTLAAPQLSAASVSSSLPILAAPMSGQLASFAAPANHNTLPSSLNIQHSTVEASSAVPVLSSVANPLPASAGAPLPILSTPASATLLAATATNSLLEASGNRSLLLAPDSGQIPLLDPSTTDTVSPLVFNTSLKLPSVASTPMPIMPASNAIPLLAATTGKVPVPFLNATSASTSLPLLSTTITTPGPPGSSITMATAVLTTSCVTIQAASMPISSVRPMAPQASVLSTTAPATSIANSALPQLSNPAPLPTLLPKPSTPTLQVKAAAFLPSGLVEVPAPMGSAIPESPTTLCPVSAEVPTQFLSSVALEPAMVPSVAASVPTPVTFSSQSVIPMVQIRPTAPQPSLPASTMTPSMPASAPAPLPSLPASTPIPIPLLPASTPTPSLPASSLDPSSLLLAPAPGPNLSSLVSPTVDPASISLKPSSASDPSVLPVSSPLTATSSSLVASAQPLLPSQTSALSPATDVQSGGIIKVKPASSPATPALQSNFSTFSSVNSLDTTPTITPTASNLDSKNFQEQSLSLSIAGPSPVSVTLGSAPDSEISLEGDDMRFTHSSTINTTVKHRRLLPPPPRSPFYLEPLEERRRKQKLERLDRIFQTNERRCSMSPIYGTEILSFCTLQQSFFGAQGSKLQTDVFRSCIFTPERHLEQLRPIIERFIIAMPPVEAPQISLHTSHPPPSMLLQESLFRETLSRELTPRTRCLHRIISNMRTQFPDLRLIQYDCGKLQTLDRLLRELKSGGHRVLLFTQMTRMLDVLEQFLNYHGHIYLRLDGSTRVEQRQALMERFNMDRRIFCFILSTRSGGVGVNLTGADTVIFYDSDWNPTMDAQAQDRCHRIGQTRDVHIYRLVSERTVEENILKKAQQKRMLGDMAIEGGNFTTAFFKQQTIRELFDMEELTRKELETRTDSPDNSAEDPSSSRQSSILEQALGKAEDEEDTLAASLVRAEQVADLAEFNENAPLEPEEEEQSRVEQEISALVEQLTPIERYAMYFLEASLEEISKEELKQAEEQVEAARKDLIQAKDEGGQNIEDKWEEEMRRGRKVRTPTPARTPGERVGVRMSERLRGNKATESSDVSEGANIAEVPLSPLKVQHHAQETADPLQDVENDNCPVSAAPSSTAVLSEPSVTSESMLPTLTPAPSQDSPAEEVGAVQHEEVIPETDLADETESVAVPSVETEVCSPTSCVAIAPGSPESSVPQEAPAAPRTPRRKVTADCEISLAGAGESSPTAKVLRRLPGRLVTVVQEKLPISRRRRNQSRDQSVTDNGALSPHPRECQSPPHDILSEGNSETGSPPRKKKRGRPPKITLDLSPTTAHSDLSPEPKSPPPAIPSEPIPPSLAFPNSCSPNFSSKLVSSSVSCLTPSSPSSSLNLVSSTSLTSAIPNVSSNLVSSTLATLTPASPSSCAKLTSEGESGSVEKRKRGRPPKRREPSPLSSSVSQAVTSTSSTVVSAVGASTSPTGSPVDAVSSSLFCASSTSPVVDSPVSPVSVLRSGILHSEITEVNVPSMHMKAKVKEKNTLVSSAVSDPAVKSIIPINSSNIPLVGGEGTSSSGTDEPATPLRRKRGRPPRSQTIPKMNSTSTALHNNKLDSSPDRTPSPRNTRAHPRKQKPLKAVNKDIKEQSSSLADTDNSSDEEVTVRTPLNRSTRTRRQADQNPPAVSKYTEATPKPRRGRSPRTTPTPDKPFIKKRKPDSASSPSPPSSSPHGSSSGKQKGARKKRNSSPAERVLRSSHTANPASNTRSSRPQLLYFPSSNRGRKAKT